MTHISAQVDLASLLEVILATAVQCCRVLGCPHGRPRVQLSRKASTCRLSRLVHGAGPRLQLRPPHATCPRAPWGARRQDHAHSHPHICSCGQRWRQHQQSRVRCCSCHRCRCTDLPCRRSCHTTHSHGRLGTCRREPQRRIPCSHNACRHAVRSAAGPDNEGAACERAGRGGARCDGDCGNTTRQAGDASNGQCRASARGQPVRYPLCHARACAAMQ